MTTPGDVFCYYGFDFGDGTVRDKLFIILNDYTQDGSSICLVLMTTSKWKRYRGALTGCNPDKAVFVIPKGKECFNEDTYVVMKVRPFPFGEFIKEGIAGITKPIGSISHRCLSDLLACLKKFKEDIAPEHWRILFPR